MYSILTPESAADGDYAEHGFVFENRGMTFGELVHEMRNYSQSSCSPRDGGTHVWVSSEGDTDYRNGEETTYSLHYSRSNRDRYAKYWRKAMQICGLTK
jgi:hypothetical protein